VTAETIGGWSFPMDELIKQAKRVPARDDNKREWIETYLELRFCVRFLSLYSDLS
jgi:hypothetical protein